ncbi:hypothetical protein ACLOJK_009374 [Asimina triloba]
MEVRVNSSIQNSKLSVAYSSFGLHHYPKPSLPTNSVSSKALHRLIAANPESRAAREHSSPRFGALISTESRTMPMTSQSPHATTLAMASHEDDKEKAQSDKPTSSPNNLTQSRQTAQQSSIDALRAAEDRYEKAKQSSAAALGQTKEAAAHGLGATTAYVAGKGSQAKDSAVHATRAAGDYTAEKGQQGFHAAKEGVVSAGQTATEKGQQGQQVVKDYTQQAAGQTKEYLVEKGQQAKDTVVQVGRRAVDYVGEKAGQAKDAVSGQKDEEAKGEHTHESELLVVMQQEHGEQQSRRTEEGKLDIGEGRPADVPAVDTGDINYSRSGEERCDENMAAKRQESREEGNRGSLLGAVGETVMDIAKSTKNLVIGRGDN